MTAAGNAPLRIWHCSHARTALNVLAKQFRSHPQLAPKEYTFLTAYLHGLEALNSELGGGGEVPRADEATYQNSFNELKEFLTETEQEGKHIFIKEHIYLMLNPRVLAAKRSPSDSRQIKPCPKVVDQSTDCPEKNGGISNVNGIIRKTNPSVLPDSFVRTLSPIIQIRHPAISIPSYYRAMTSIKATDDISSDRFLSGTTYAWSRKTFDWFCEHVYHQRKEISRGHHSWPPVVDGDDLVNENERIVAAICSLANLNEKGITKEWSPISKEIRQKQPENFKRFLSTLQASTGIIKSGLKGEDIVVEEEAKKWVEEFGPEIGERL
ncbi:MAG: hypothetical protein Q9213_004718 [Squamulea squamosa]